MLCTRVPVPWRRSQPPCHSQRADHRCMTLLSTSTGSSFHWRHCAHPRRGHLRIISAAHSGWENASAHHRRSGSSAALAESPAIQSPPRARLERVEGFFHYRYVLVLTTTRNRLQRVGPLRRPADRRGPGVELSEHRGNHTLGQSLSARISLVRKVNEAARSNSSSLTRECNSMRF